MHGGLSQNQRTRALRAFADGKVPALVATDVAARGIHVEAVDVVLHYDLANDHTDYVHRSGRTARAGATGTVISLVVDGQDRDVRKIQRAIDLKAPIEAPNMEWKRMDRERPIPSPARPKGPAPKGETRPKLRRSSDADNLRIYVGNLAWRTSVGDLRELFSTHGPVESATIRTEKSGRSKGFGFVDMSPTDAHTAIDAVNGATLDGRPLRVRAAW
jgi:superfamily II DNA/RNA helicase